MPWRRSRPGDSTPTARPRSSPSSTAKGKREVVFRGALQPLVYAPPQLVVWRGDSTHLPRETLVVTLREEACGGAATHRAVLSVKAGEAMLGCCTVRTGYDARIAPVANFATKNPDDWARLLPDLLPAINQCVAREGNRAKWIARRRADQRRGRASYGWSKRPAARSIAWRTSRDAARPKIDARQRRGRATAARQSAVLSAARPAADGELRQARARSSPKSGAVAGYLHYDPC